MILPLKDSIPNIHKPVMVWAVILATSVLFLLQMTLTPREFALTLVQFGLVPSSVPVDNTGTLGGLAGFVTYMFLHTGWWHAISNLWILWIFANNIEDVTGPWRFLLFYLACGILAGLAHVFANQGAAVPVVGASGAISGVLGAYFLLYPHAKITTFVFFLIVRLPATVYIGGWFLLQLYAGLQNDSDSVAWWAHLGGFAAGMALLPFFRTNRAAPSVLPKPTPPKPAHDPKDPWAHLRSR